jgi:hypothetical protein
MGTLHALTGGATVKNNNTQQNTFNIYGTDPHQTANAVDSKLNSFDIYTRAFKGAIP